jgi:hypothetical protein
MICYFTKASTAFLMMTLFVSGRANGWTADKSPNEAAKKTSQIAVKKVKERGGCRFGGGIPKELLRKELKPEHVFVIDTSKSMRGLPQGSGNVNILPKVKKKVLTTIRSRALSGARVTFYTFDKKIRGPFGRVLNSKEDIKWAVNFVKKLPIEGKTTYLYKALDKIFTYLVKKSKARKAGIQAVYVYTDGRDHSPGKQKYSLEKIIKKFNLARQAHPFLFVNYVTLGVKLSAEELKKIGNKWVVVQAAKGVVPDLKIVTLDPYILDLGNMHSGKQQKVERSVRVRTSAKAAGVENNSIDVEMVFKRASESGVLYQIRPETLPIRDDAIKFTIRRDNPWPKSVVPGTYWGCLKLESNAPNVVLLPQEIPIRIDLRPAETIEIKPPLGKSKATHHKVKPWEKEDPAERVVQHTLKLYPNAAAEKADTPIEVVLRQDEGPETLDARLVVGKGETMRRGEKLTIRPSDKELKLEIAYGEKAGRYKGRILFRPKNVELKGKNIEKAKGDEAEYQYAYTLEICDKPIWRKLWFLLMCGLAVLLLAVLLCFVLRPKFPRSLYIEEPAYLLATRNPRFCLWPWRTVGGSRSDIIVPGLPPRPILRIKPRGATDVTAEALVPIILDDMPKGPKKRFLWTLGQTVAAEENPENKVELNRLDLR